MSKYFNKAVIGNSKILATLDDKCELLRLYYPDIDYYQNIDKNSLAIVRDGRLLKLENATTKKQYYEGNIVYTLLELEDFEILIRDYVLINKNVVVRTLKMNKKADVFLYSKLNSSKDRKVSSMIADNTLIQCCQEMYMATFSTEKIVNYQINNSKYTLDNPNLNQEDYIGMSEDSAIIFNSTNEITIYIALNDTLKSTLELVEWCKNQEENLLYETTKKYWNEYLAKFQNNSLYLNTTKIKEKEIIDRTILLYALITNPETGAVLASPDVDEDNSKCGRYGYCWPRDGIFINKALNILGLKQVTDKFYSVWAPRAQLKNGLFEQRYYSNGELAPSWGLQIDETAAILIGIYENGKYKELESTIVKTVAALINFIDTDYLSKECYDIWEERKGKHLYSTASIYEGLRVGKEMLSRIDKDRYKETIEDINRILSKMKDAILINFVEEGALKRSVNDNLTDISVLSLVVPYHILDANDLLIEKTMEKIERDLHVQNGGYMRYAWDKYINGNPWIISILWVALYYVEKGDIVKAEELFDWVTNHADNMYFLPEQIDINGDKSIWVTQLSWSHAMYIIVKARIINFKNNQK